MAILLGIVTDFCYTAQLNVFVIGLIWVIRVSALWAWHDEPQFINGAEWPICLSTDECCPLIFPTWTANHIGRSHQGPNHPPVVSGSADISDIAKVPRLISFRCYDQVPTAEREAAGESYSQGPFYILCPVMTEAVYRASVERNLPGAQGFWVRNARCQNPDSTIRTFSDAIGAGITACRQLVTGGDQHQTLMMAFRTSSVVHPLTSNTGIDRSQLTDEAAIAGFLLSVIPMDTREIAIEESELQLSYETRSNKTYRVCGRVPPGHGNWNLKILLMS